MLQGGCCRRDCHWILRLCRQVTTQSCLIFFFLNVCSATTLETGITSATLILLAIASTGGNSSMSCSDLRCLLSIALLCTVRNQKGTTAGGLHVVIDTVLDDSKSQWYNRSKWWTTLRLFLHCSNKLSQGPKIFGSRVLWAIYVWKYHSTDTQTMKSFHVA